MADEMVLSKDQFLNAARIPATEEVVINASGQKAVVTELDSRLAILVDAETHEAAPGGRGRRIKEDGLFNARWIAATLRSPDGKRMFTINDSPEDRRPTVAGVPGGHPKPLFDQAELEAIAAMPTRASERLISAALRLNSVSDAAVDAAAKN